MKILQLGKFYPPDIGGIETVMYDITDVLNQDSAIQCDVLCSNNDYTYKLETFNGYKIIRTKTFGKYFSTSITPQMIYKLKQIVNGYDLIHIHLPDPMANLAMFIVNPKKQKIVLHWHSDIIKQKYLLKLYEPLQNWLMKKADKIIATTPKYIEESKYLQIYKDKCISIPIGIDETKLIANEDKVLELKNQYKDKRIIFSLGRLAYYKGFEFLIESAKYLDDSYIILIGGGGELKESLESIIVNNNLQNKVKLLGRIEDIDLGSYYEACDIYCLSSIVKSEAFGIVQIEAMSFSKPVVATKIEGSGVDWVNQDGISGVNVEPKNSKALAEGFKNIINDKYNDYSQGAVNRFNNNFKRLKMTNTIKGLYEVLLC